MENLQNIKLEVLKNTSAITAIEKVVTLARVCAIHL